LPFLSNRFLRNSMKKIAADQSRQLGEMQLPSAVARQPGSRLEQLRGYSNPTSAPTLEKASKARSISSRSRAAEAWTRNLAVPSGTTG
jgi:hypothetical protein